MRWFRFWMTVAAWYQWASEWMETRIQNIRNILFYTLLHRYEPRSLFLLKNGQWVDVGRGFRIDQVVWMYDAARHTIHRPIETGVTRGERWPWLGVAEFAEGGRDLTDFFTELRIVRGIGPAPSTATILGLFAVQKGWMPDGQLAITRRDGEEMVIDATTGAVVQSSEVAPSVSHVDHIQ